MSVCRLEFGTVLTMYNVSVIHLIAMTYILLNYFPEKLFPQL